MFLLFLASFATESRKPTVRVTKVIQNLSFKAESEKLVLWNKAGYNVESCPIAKLFGYL
jgi:hypothetical protein